MKVGFDIDGVLADFVRAYNRLIVAKTGRDLFQPEDWTNPPVWDYPEYRGYTDAEIADVWTWIKASPTLCYALDPTDECSTMAMMLPELEHKHDVYYITTRTGAGCKRQTEAWLYRYLPYKETGVTPTVLIVGKGTKGAAARALGLDCFIDDNRDNCIDVAVNSNARSYLLSRAYNAGTLSRNSFRVDTLGQFFDCELSRL